jgi:AcrR family transcriptional regulator
VQAPPKPTPAQAKSRRGRPRDPRRHEAILEATRQLILDGGYNRVSFEAVAQRAGVSRMTVHKWWNHRVELVEEALFPDYGELPAPDTGSFEEDLQRLVKEMVDRLTQPLLVLGMPPLRAELNANPQLLHSTGRRYGAPSHRRWKAVFDRAAERGEIKSGADPMAAMHVVLGAIEALSQARPTVLSRRKMIPYLVTLLLRGAVEVPSPRSERRSGHA